MKTNTLMTMKKETNENNENNDYSYINIKRFIISIVITLAFFLIAISASTIVNSCF